MNTLKHIDFIVKNKTAEEWNNYLVVLRDGQLAIEKDTQKMKLGNGFDIFRNLPYINLSPDEINSMIQNSELKVTEYIDNNVSAIESQVSIAESCAENAEKHAIDSKKSADLAQKAADSIYTILDGGRPSRIITYVIDGGSPGQRASEGTIDELC